MVGRRPAQSTGRGQEGAAGKVGGCGHGGGSEVIGRIVSEAGAVRPDKAVTLTVVSIAPAGKTPVRHPCRFFSADSTATMHAAFPDSPAAGVPCGDSGRPPAPPSGSRSRCFLLRPRPTAGTAAAAEEERRRAGEADGRAVQPAEGRRPQEVRRRHHQGRQDAARRVRRPPHRRQGLLRDPARTASTG